MKKFLLTILIVFLGLTSFSQKKLVYDLYYYTNPNHKIKVYNKLLVITNAGPEASANMKSDSKKTKYNAVLYDQLFPPYKKWSEAEVDSTILASNIDGIIFVTIKNVNTYQETSGRTSLLPISTSIMPITTVSNSTTVTKAGNTELEIYLIDVQKPDEYVFFCSGYVAGKPIPAASKSFYHALKKFPKIGVAIPPNKK